MISPLLPEQQGKHLKGLWHFQNKVSKIRARKTANMHATGMILVVIPANPKHLPIRQLQAWLRDLATSSFVLGGVI